MRAYSLSDRPYPAACLQPQAAPGHQGRRYHAGDTRAGTVSGSAARPVGFNVTIVTDASQVVGRTSKMKRELMVPVAIASGCDMLSLYYRDKDEDTKNVKKAIVIESRKRVSTKR